VAVLDAHSHDLHQLGGLDGVAVLGDGHHSVAEALAELGKHAGGTGVDAQRILNGIVKLLHGIYLLFIRKHANGFKCCGRWRLNPAFFLIICNFSQKD